jgi:hypothetical protein
MLVNAQRQLAKCEDLIVAQNLKKDVKLLRG